MASNNAKRPKTGVKALVFMVIKWCEYIAAFSLFLMMAVSFIDVMGRTLFNAPLSGATELTELFVAATVCAAFPPISFRGIHATIDIFDGILPSGLLPYQKAIANLLGTLCFAVVSWRVWIEGIKTAKFGGHTPYLEIPLAQVYYMISILSGVTALAFLMAVIFQEAHSDD